MEPEQGEKRFENAEEVVNEEGQAIGFTLPGNDFFFKYLSNGGWRDEKGNKYNSEGVLVKASDVHSDDDDDEEDEQILDEFQKMLDDDCVEKKQQKVSKEEAIAKEEDTVVKQEDEVDYEQETIKYIQQYKNKQKIRDGLPSELHIYFKTKEQHRVSIKLVVETLQSVQQRNAEIKKIQEEAQTQTNSLKEKNKWLTESAQFDFSGVCSNDVDYYRYWYGHLKTSAQNYLQLKKQIQQSEEFGLLEEKTFYALKSKFYLKKKMQKTIQDELEKIKDIEDDHSITVTINNLPENFSCSYILDLFDYSDTPLEEIQKIELIDEYTAKITLSKKATVKFLNVEGFCHAQKQFIYLDVVPNEGKINSGVFYTISTDSKHKSHFSELNDVMALTMSKQEVVKSVSKQEEEKCGYRMIVGRKALKKVLMYRGNSLNVIKVGLYVKQ